MPCSSAPKKIINLHANKAICGTAIKKKASERADGSTGYGLSKKDRYGNAYYSYWTKDVCPEEHRQIVYVSVDAAAEKAGVCSGAFTYDQLRKHSLDRLREIPFYVKFGAQLKFCISAHELHLCQQNEKRRPKGTYGAVWVEGSDRDGYYRAVTPHWKQERIEHDGHSSPEVYHDLQRAAVMAKFD